MKSLLFITFIIIVGLGYMTYQKFPDNRSEKDPAVFSSTSATMPGRSDIEQERLEAAILDLLQEHPGEVHMHNDTATWYGEAQTVQSIGRSAVFSISNIHYYLSHPEETWIHGKVKVSLSIIE